MVGNNGIKLRLVVCFLINVVLLSIDYYWGLGSFVGFCFIVLWVIILKCKFMLFLEFRVLSLRIVLF